MNLNPDAGSYVPVKMANNEEMYGLLMNMVEQQAVPDIELECFDGYPLKQLFGHIQKSNGEMDSRT